MKQDRTIKILDDYTLATQNEQAFLGHVLVVSGESIRNPLIMEYEDLQRSSRPGGRE